MILRWLQVLANIGEDSFNGLQFHFEAETVKSGIFPITHNPAHLLHFLFPSPLNPSIRPLGSLFKDSSNKSRPPSFLAVLLLVDNLHHIHNEGLKLDLRDLPVPIRVQLAEDVADVLLGGCFDIEGVGQSAQELAELMPLDVAGVVGVEGVEGVLEFPLGKVQNLLKAHSIIGMDGSSP